MGRLFFALAMLSPGRQLAFRRALVAHVILVGAGSWSVFRGGSPATGGTTGSGGAVGFGGAGGAAMGFLLLAVAFAIIKTGRRLVNNERVYSGRLSRRGWIGRFIGWLSARLTAGAPDSTRVIIAFYEEFQSLVSAAGLIPRQDQTQREFARQVEEALAGRLAPAGLQRFPGELAEMFYRVRFGDGSLQPLETLELEGRLNRLRESLTAT